MKNFILQLKKSNTFLEGALGGFLGLYITALVIVSCAN